MDTQKIKELEVFMSKLNTAPPESELQPTPDGKAKTLPISFVEMKLDEIYMGLWGFENFTTRTVANEIVGEGALWVVHPVTGDKITRTGAAAIQIMVDKAPPNLQGTEKNKWALNLDNKKPSALDMGYPKLKSEAVKNAAQSLGKIFGRDINRRQFDHYNAEYTPEIEAQQALEPIINKLAACTEVEALLIEWETYPDLHSNLKFKNAFSAFRNALKLKQKQLTHV